ncbi:MAG: phytase [Pseudomonadota bacterium]
MERKTKRRGLSGLAAGCGLLLAACEPGSEVGETSATEAPEAAAPADNLLTPSDRILDLPRPISDAAYWTHPSLPFRGAIAAVDGARLALWDLEAQLLDEREGRFGPALDVRYGGSPEGDGPEAARPALLATYDADIEAFVFFTIDLADRVLAPLGWAQTDAAPQALCLSQGSTPDELYLFASTDAPGLRQFALEQTADGVEATLIRETPLVAEALHCVGDDVFGYVYLSDADGALVRVARDPSEDVIAENVSNGALIARSTGLGLVYQAGGQAFLLAGEGDTANPSILIYDLSTITFDGAFSLDAENMGAATALSATNANLGGVYRDGMVVAGLGATANAGARILYAPWNGVANALELPLSRGPQPRDLGLPPKPARAPDQSGGVQIDIPPAPEP